jgi:hypothetical protein
MQAFVVAQYWHSERSTPFPGQWRQPEVNPPLGIACESALSEAETTFLSGAGRRTLRSPFARGWPPEFAWLQRSLRRTPALLTLLEKYDNVPMSVADACTVRSQRILSDPLVLTRMPNFRIYRRQRFAK